MIASAVAHQAAARVPNALVAPPLAIGASGEHQGFPGTLSVGTEVFAAAIVEIVRSAGPEFSRVVLVNGHGGNADAVVRADETCRAEGRNVSVWFPRVVGGDAHAGATETSVMLALAPDQVRRADAVVGATEPLPEVLDQLRRGGVRSVSANGVLGDPRSASAEQGQVIIDQWVEEVVELLTR